MKITKVEYWVKDIQLREHYTIAYNTYTSAENIFLRVETNKGITGFGCAAPDYEVTSENSETVLNACKDVIEPGILGSDPLRRVAIFCRLDKHLHYQPAAKAMLDMALYDILGKCAGLPLYKILGGYRTHIKTSVTIGILPLEETLAKAKKFITEGFSVIKLKGGIDVDEDIEKVIRLRELVGHKIALRFDANQGYNSEKTLKFISSTMSAKLQLIEQPIHRDYPLVLGKITKSSNIPIMADESLISLKDTFKLVRNKLVDLVNIKLMKVGGIYEAIRISSIASVGNIETMVGCMDNSALAISAGLHFALSRPNVQYADLDGHLDMIDDPSAGAVILNNGVLYPTNRPGLGFDLK